MSSSTWQGCLPRLPQPCLRLCKGIIKPLFGQSDKYQLPCSGLGCDRTRPWADRPLDIKSVAADALHGM